MRKIATMINFWLQSALSSSGLSQAELAKRLTTALGRSVDRAAVNKMVGGERRILADEMLEIARICDFPLPVVGKKPLSEYESALKAIELSHGKLEYLKEDRPLIDEDVIQIRLSVLKGKLLISLQGQKVEEHTANAISDALVFDLKTSAEGAEVFVID